jgi:hypothetical protein
MRNLLSSPPCEPELSEAKVSIERGTPNLNY